VVDLRLPDIDGLKLVKIMKFKAPGVPIVLITGYADKYNMEEIRDLKVSAFLEKPFSADELSDQFVKVMQDRQAVPSVKEEKEEARSESAYIMLKVSEDADFIQTYQDLYYMDNVLYCDAVNGDYDIIMLVQADNMNKIHEIADTRIKTVEGVNSVQFLGVENPVLDDCTQTIIKDAEEALENGTTPGNVRDMSRKVASYILMEVEKEKMDELYPAVRLNDNVVYCDYTNGKSNLVLFVTGSYFDEIHRFIDQKIINLDGVLKVKEYPIVNLHEM
jgi:DNA-binding Lrp family transcriptional regulator